jgi:hypothetical protein
MFLERRVSTSFIGKGCTYLAYGRIRLLDHEKVKTRDYEKIIEQNREEYSLLEAVIR